jgi:hypothetical protein
VPPATLQRMAREIEVHTGHQVAAYWAQACCAYSSILEEEMDAEKAIAYVQTHGDVVERARLAAILWNEPPSEAALQELVALQKSDGGFAYWVREVSSSPRTPNRWRIPD